MHEHYTRPLQRSKGRGRLFPCLCVEIGGQPPAKARKDKLLPTDAHIAAHGRPYCCPQTPILLPTDAHIAAHIFIRVTQEFPILLLLDAEGNTQRVAALPVQIRREAYCACAYIRASASHLHHMTYNITYVTGTYVYIEMVTLCMEIAPSKARSPLIKSTNNRINQ